ncbi:MAG TPA: DUF2269 family protein [Mycobacteriales bacterium]|nr:DUF2269 family protein [Mycobacteriales bacterium]
MVNIRNVLLWLHILVAMVTLGPLILFDVLGPAAIRAGNVGAVRAIHSWAGRLGPMTVLIAVIGLILVFRDGDDIFKISDGWILGAVAIYVTMVVNGVAILGTTLGRAATRLEAGESTAAELSRLYLFGALNIVLFCVILWLMVAKPGLG